MPEGLSGIIERVTFHKPENGYAVLRVQASGRRGQITVIGHLPAVLRRRIPRGEGDWIQDRDHGLQFKATNLRITPPPHQGRDCQIPRLWAGERNRTKPTLARSLTCLVTARSPSSTKARPSFRK